MDKEGGEDEEEEEEEEGGGEKEEELKDTHRYSGTLPQSLTRCLSCVFAKSLSVVYVVRQSIGPLGLRAIRQNQSPFLQDSRLPTFF